MEMRVVEVAPMPVVYLRNVGPYGGSGISQAWSRLCGWAAPRGLLGGPVRLLGVGHDDPRVTPAEKCRYDACLTIAGAVLPEGEIGVQTVGGGKYVMATHVGPYEKLGDTYAWLRGPGVNASGGTLRDEPCFEEYMNNPQTTPKEQLRTDVYVPIV